MNFGEALAALKEGKKVARSIWGGYWMLVGDAHFSGFSGDTWNGPVTAQFKYIIVAVLKDNKRYAPAQPYQEDLLAEDWRIVD